MKKNRTSISKASSYREIGEYWDTHDTSRYWKKTPFVKFDIDIQTERIYYALDKDLSNQINVVARKKGISGDTLVNLWVQEKLKKIK